MPNFFSNILDRLIPKRVEFREEESDRASARAARKKEREEKNKWKFDIMERVLDQPKKTEPIIDEEIQIKQMRIEKNWVEKAVRKYFSPRDPQCIEGQPRMYEVEIAPPRPLHKPKLDTYVYAYVECRDSKHGATVLIWIPEMFGHVESFKALAFFDDEVFELNDSKTIEMAWRIFAPLFDYMAA